MRSAPVEAVRGEPCSTQRRREYVQAVGRCVNLLTDRYIGAWHSCGNLNSDSVLTNEPR